MTVTCVWVLLVVDFDVVVGVELDGSSFSVVDSGSFDDVVDDVDDDVDDVVEVVDSGSGSSLITRPFKSRNAPSPLLQHL